MKQSFFYTSLSLAVILGLILAAYIFGWTTPTTNPPSSNLPAPINTGSSNQSKSGYLAVGTSTTPTYPLEVGNQLRVWGQIISKVASGTAPFVIDSPTKVANLNADTLDSYDSADLLGGSVEIPVTTATYFYNGGNRYYCKKKAVDSNGYVTFTNINANLECDTNKYCSNGECVSGLNNVYCDEDNDSHYTTVAVASPSNCPSGRYRYNQPGDDCDDSCAQCYLGSLYYSLSPNGKDEDCDGTVDNSLPLYYLFVSSSTYTGNVGGRSGADNKCQNDPNRPSDVTGTAWAFASFTDSDEIRDFVTTKGVSSTSPWKWKYGNVTAEAGRDFADLLDGGILNNARTVGYPHTFVWTFSQRDGALSSNNCNRGSDGSANYNGDCGCTNEYYTYKWITQATVYTQCDYSYRLYCAVQSSSPIYR